MRGICDNFIPPVSPIKFLLRHESESKNTPICLIYLCKIERDF